MDADYVLVLSFHHRDLEPDCVGVSTRGEGGVGGERRTRGREMLLTLAVGWRASALRGGEAGRFRKVAGVSIVLQAVHIHGRQFNSRQPSCLNKLAIV